MKTADGVIRLQLSTHQHRLSRQIETKIRELVETLLSELADASIANDELIKHSAILHKENQELREEIDALKRQQAKIT